MTGQQILDTIEEKEQIIVKNNIRISAIFGNVVFVYEQHQLELQNIYLRNEITGLKVQKQALLNNQIDSLIND